jgi:hypothetical protein
MSSWGDLWEWGFGILWLGGRGFLQSNSFLGGGDIYGIWLGCVLLTGFVLEVFFGVCRLYGIRYHSNVGRGKRGAHAVFVNYCQ